MTDRHPPPGGRGRQVAGHPALTASDLHGAPAGPGHDLVEETVAVLPVGVVAGGPGPQDPIVRLLVPVDFLLHQDDARGSGLGQAAGYRARSRGILMAPSVVAREGNLPRCARPVRSGPNPTRRRRARRVPTDGG